MWEVFESGVQDPKPPRPLSHRMVPPVLAEVPAKLKQNPAAIRIKATVKLSTSTAIAKATVKPSQHKRCLCFT